MEMVVLVLVLILPAAMLGFLTPSCSTAVEEVRNVLYSGEILKTTESLSWGNYVGEGFRLRMNEDCNLCVREAGGWVWCVGTGGGGQNCYLRLQHDGNLVLYNGRHKRLWTSDTRSVHGKYVFVYQNDGNTVLYGKSRWSAIDASNNTHPPVPTDPPVQTEANEQVIKSVVVGEPTPPNNILYTGQNLTSGQQLTWGNFRLTMEYNCNLGIFKNDKMVWSTDTCGKRRNCYTRMENDGNLVVYTSSHTRLWSTDIQNGEGSYVCILQKDGNLVIYGEERWSTNTAK